MTDVTSYPVTLGDRGRLVLPAPLRRELDLRPGDRLLLRPQKDGTVQLVSARKLAKELQGMFRDLAPGRSLVDELIAERRTEAEREERENG